MKKPLILGLTTMVTLGSLAGSLAPAAHASENEVASSSLTENVLEVASSSLTENVLEVAPYVYKNDQGLLSVDNNIPRYLYIENDVEALEKRFETINAQVANGEVTINDDLSITSNMMTTRASKGYTSETFWWGEKATYTNAQTKTAVQQTNSAAIDTALIGAGTLFIPVFGSAFAPIVGLTSAYLFNLADYMSTANKGKGIILNMTWAFIYSTESR